MVEEVDVSWVVSTSIYILHGWGSAGAGLHRFFFFFFGKGSSRPQARRKRSCPMGGRRWKVNGRGEGRGSSESNGRAGLKGGFGILGS